MPVDVEERQIEVGRLLTRHLIAGEGTPLVLLHALGESALDWRSVLPDLARSRRVYAAALLGLVGSANKPADYSPACFARFAAAYFDALEIERAAVVGNSLGGLVALRLALSEPGRVSSPGTESWRQPGAMPPSAAQRAWLKARLLSHVQNASPTSGCSPPLKRERRSLASEGAL